MCRSICEKQYFPAMSWSDGGGCRHGFTKALALEVAKKGVTVNTISPGYIGTKMVTAIPEEILNTKILPQIPVGRLGKPEEVAGLIIYLASEDAAFVTGASIAINGGQHMQQDQCARRYDPTPGDTNDQMRKSGRTVPLTVSYGAPPRQCRQLARTATSWVAHVGRLKTGCSRSSLAVERQQPPKLATRRWSRRMAAVSSEPVARFVNGHRHGGRPRRVSDVSTLGSSPWNNLGTCPTPARCAEKGFCRSRV